MLWAETALRLVCLAGLSLLRCSVHHRLAVGGSGGRWAGEGAEGWDVDKLRWQAATVDMLISCRKGGRVPGAGSG